MERYSFTEEQRTLMEEMQVPFAIFQLVNKRITTLVVSNGFCRLLGSEDRAAVYAAMDNDTFRNVHPDDAARLGNAVFRFMREGGRFESVYRLKKPNAPGWLIIHAYGTFVYKEEGVRLAQIWYADEGTYNSEENRNGTALSQSLSNALHEESILRASYYDYLTGLPSMTHFFELAEAGKEVIRKNGDNPVLMYMDFSGMKFYNSKHGFTEGDNLLRSFARVLIKIFGLERCCRIGADHFAVQAEERGLDEKIKQMFAECQELNGGKTLPVHVGVYPAKSEDVHTSIECDRAKLACRALSGRYETAVNYYSQDMKDDALKKQYILENFDKALAEKWITVYYQPIVRAVNGRVCDEEALARWIDPTEGFLSPAEFIPVLEEAGLIYRLDLYVLEQVLEKLRQEAAAGLYIVPQSINLSRFDFSACDIVEEIRKRVDASGVGRDKITIEITESVIGSDFDFMKEQVERFRSLGFPVWMDDFGSGYSSLDVLQSIRFDLIKFDMSFMRELDKGENAKTILTELVKMAASLDVDTVCEGVEKEEQVHFLQEIGCSKLQGFYYCRPIPLPEIMERYRKGIQIGYEDPAASAYYETIGRINLYDLAVIANDDAAFQTAFNTLPIGILEIRGDRAQYVRCSRSYQDFMLRFFGFDVTQQTVDFSGEPIGYGPAFMKAVKQCCEDGSRAFFDEIMPDGSKVHTFVRRIGTNPVTDSIAVAIAVLSIREPNEAIMIEQILSVIEQFGEHMPGGFFIYKADESEELLYANRAVFDMYGCDGLEDFKAFTGFTFRGMVHPEDYEKISASIKDQVNESESDLDFVEYRIIRKDGEVRWIDDYGHYMKYGADSGLYYVFISDITDKHERTESDKALRSAVIEALTKSYDSVWLINDVETQRFELFRIDKEMEHLMPAHVAVQIKKFSEAFAFYSRLVLEEDRQRFLEAVTPENIVRNTEDKLIYSVPFRRVFDDGIRYYRLEFAKLDLPGGKTGIVGGFKNVDEEVRKDQQIQRSLNQRAAVIEALTQVYDSVWLISDMETQRFELYRIDEKMVHLMPAQEAVKITRFSDAFAFYSKLVLEEDRQRFLEAVTPENIIRNTENKLIYSVPFRRMFESGVRYYRVEFARLNLGNGEINIVTGFKDVDEEVRKEQQIQQALREAIDAANASNKAKSDFLSSMSHDMRTPMNGIIGMTTIAANHLDDRERVADCLRKITDSSRHLLSLINDVLDMNKIESGKVELHEEEFCLADLIDGMLAMTRPQIQAHEHSFRVNIIDVEHEQLIGDSRRIEQVFVNILSNAIKYTPNGGKISLSVRELPSRMQGFGHYQFVFEDNGYGMTEEFQKHLFEPFARANDKQTAGIQGTGLGMAITRNIVRMMGGDISVESVYGEGSRFTVNLYLKLQSTEHIDYASFVDLRVLVADDDPVCCESTCEILSDMGMNSEWVLSGKAAVDRVKARIEQGRDFSAVIIDWKLPDQGGVETARKIRKLVGEDMPIVMFSAYDWSGIEQDAREAGANAFISKPLFRTKLAALFNSLFNRPAGEDDLEAPLRELEEMGLDGRRVLLAEDQELNAEIATDFLEMTGVTVDWAKDGREAVEKLAASPDGYYSMIFMDVQMPNMNGYEATKAIRAMDRPYAREIPIVAMTANAFLEDVLQAKKAGMNEHITKPIDVEVLTRVLRTYVK